MTTKRNLPARLRDAGVSHVIILSDGGVEVYMKTPEVIQFSTVDEVEAIALERPQRPTLWNVLRDLVSL